MYGVLDAGYSTFSAENGTSKYTAKGIAYSAIDTSRWGITSTEDLGGGLAASFNIESGLTGTPRDNFNYNGATSGSGTSSNAAKLFGGVNGDLGAVAGGGNFSSSTGGGFAPNAVVFGDRKLNVGITSGASKVQVGFDSSTVRAAVVAYQPMDGNMLGNLVANDRSLTGASAGQGRNKAISYIYTQPTWNATLGYVLGNTVDATGADQTKVTNGNQYGLNYAQGPLALSVAGATYQGHVNAVTGVLGVLGDSATAPVIGVKAAVPTDIKTQQTVFGASYDLQVVKLTAQYGKVQIKDQTQAAGAAADDLRSMYSIGAVVPVGAGNVFAQYSKGKDQYGAAGAFQGDTSGYSFGYRHSFSKRTTAYAAMGHVKASTSATNDVIANQTSFGLLHAF